MNSFFSKKWLIIFLAGSVLMVVVFLILIVSRRFQTSSVSEIEQTGETRIEIPLTNTIIGKTTGAEIEVREDVLDVVEVDGGSLYKLQSGRPTQPHEVLVKDGVVAREVTVVSVKSTELYEYPRITDYLRAYGNPEGVLSGSVRRGPFVETYLYPSRGVAIIGNPHTNEVLEFERFLPMTMEEYMEVYGEGFVTLDDYQSESHQHETL